MLRSLRTPGIRGEESAKEALSQLLSDSGLTYRVVNDVVQIAQAEPAIPHDPPVLHDDA